ncbi:hypothetical protein AB0F88_42330 [Streptosporangium sp. NPDC023963]|uniref:ATP-binding protein n=1 Tax=Streptosporangium sp. NPDC023963 TaxID=3155608 RepID=UPI00342F73F4
MLKGLDHPHTDDALLLLTELVTNSVRHSDSGRCPSGRITIAVAHHDGTLHIDVIDAGSTAGHRPLVCVGVPPRQRRRAWTLAGQGAVVGLGVVRDPCRTCRLVPAERAVTSWSAGNTRPIASAHAKSIARGAFRHGHEPDCTIIPISCPCKNYCALSSHF